MARRGLRQDRSGFPWVRHLVVRFALLGAAILPVSAQAEPRAYEPQPAPTSKSSWGEILPAIQPRTGGTNYFVINARDFRDDCHDRCEGGLVQFRVDLEYDITRVEKYPKAGFFYLTFPIRFLSIWDLFDTLPGSQSSPFLETNYAPGLEFSWVAPRPENPPPLGGRERSDWHGVRFGVLHESNGLGFVTQTKNDQLDNSRSWNRIYAGTRWVVFDGPAIGLMLDVTAWIPFGDDIVDGWPNGATVDGRIAHSIGYGELLANVRTTFGRLASFNWRFIARARSLDAELRWSIKKAQILDTEGLHGNGFRLDLLARCFFGKGERLMVANENHTSCYAGLGL